MQTNPIELEEKRLAALARYDVIDTPAEEGFDRITRLAARIFGVPMSTIALSMDTGSGSNPGADYKAAKPIAVPHFAM